MNSKRKIDPGDPGCIAIIVTAFFVLLSFFA